jgi:hypothetical protein
MGTDPSDPTSADVPLLTDEQTRELARRRAEGLSDPAATVDWASVRELLKKR